MAEGSVFKMCSCLTEDGRRLRTRCPKLRRPSGSWHQTHGWWTYQIELPTSDTGKRRMLRRGHYATSDEAAAERASARDLLALACGDRQVAIQIGDLLAALRGNQPLPDPGTIARRVRGGVPAHTSSSMAAYLTDWHANRRGLAGSTIHVSGGHIRNYLIPHLGDIPIDGLRVAHIQAMFTAIADRNIRIEAARASDDPAVRATVKGMVVVSGATMHRIRATLRKALNDAIRAHRLIEFNPAVYVELPSGRRPKAKVWTKAAVKAWQATGARPSPVMVWTPDQAGAFLDYAETHEVALYPLYALILHRGLRRGEAVGLRDADVDLDTRLATIAQQITTVAYKPVTKAVKSDAGERTIVLDAATIAILRAHRARRNRWQLAAGPKWRDTGLLFVTPTGAPWHPDQVTNRFEVLIRDSGLPPIRLHDLRHCAATYLKAAGADIKDIQETLGHSSSTITSDTYTSVILEMESEAAKADAAVNLIPRTQPRAS